MPAIKRLVVLSICIHSCLVSPLSAAEGVARGWLAWRGPQQNGTSAETGLPDKVDSSAPLWTIDLPGRGTPVINGNKVYVLGYEGAGPNLQQVLRCVEADTGRKIWEERFNDFLSDTVYERYSIGSPVIDRETGNVYVLTTAGEFVAFTGDWRTTLGALDDGGLRAAYLPEWPRRFSGDRRRPHHRAWHYEQLGSARSGSRSLLRFRQENR